MASDGNGGVQKVKNTRIHFPLCDALVNLETTDSH